ncbi:hypothetical protein ACET3Z_025722 [Daucus carota]
MAIQRTNGRAKAGFRNGNQNSKSSAKSAAPEGDQSKDTRRWEEVITIPKDKFKEIKEEALKWDKLIEGDAIGALKAGDSDSWRVAENQIHYKSMRNMNKKEYEEDANTRKYVEALLGTNSRWKEKYMVGNDDSEWTVVEKKRRKGRKAGATIFVAKNTVESKGLRSLELLRKGSKGDGHHSSKEKGQEK